MADNLRYKLLYDGDILVCRLNHARTIISKILSSKFLRRWEPHQIVLSESTIHSRTATGFMDTAIPYSSIQDLYVVSRWDAGQKFCVRIMLPMGSLLLQSSNMYLRDQWLYSIQWKRAIYRFKKILSTTKRSDVLVREIKNLVEMTQNTFLQDDDIYHTPLEIMSEILPKKEDILINEARESIIVSLASLFESNNPSPELCLFFSKHCQAYPRSCVIVEVFTPVVQRILKHYVDFGKFPQMRNFVQDYILALQAKNEGEKMVDTFIQSMHGPTSLCPHPRVLPNLVSVCLASIYSYYEENKQMNNNGGSLVVSRNIVEEELMTCFVCILIQMSSYDDWLLNLTSLLQPIPFPKAALIDNKFTEIFKVVVQRIAEDTRCEVHQSVLGVREGKEGWIHLYCPGGLTCNDDGELLSLMMKRLLNCCCKRKKFLIPVSKMLLGPCMLLALRRDQTMIELLCLMLEMNILDNSDARLQVVTALQSTNEGRLMYNNLCEREIAIKELQQLGGPTTLSLPAKSTDADLKQLLLTGSMFNLENLNLAFTHVTSACAEWLIKLPNLKYLNLWSTQFGDPGLHVISEHMHKLQVLNLCETPVTDKGLTSLSSIMSLRKLNLNSTQLSALTFADLKTKLPRLEECDVRYTEAW